MSKKPKKDRINVVYSTNPDFRYEHDKEEEEETLAPSAQLLALHRETKGRAGKAAIIVRGFVGTEDDLEDLGKRIKSHCGTGGSVKDGEIIIQGDQRPKIESFLRSHGYKTKNVGG